MSDTQLYLAIGIPSALFMLNFTAILAGFFWQSKRFDDLKDLMKAEIGRVEGVLGQKIDGLSARVKALEERDGSLLSKR